MRLPKELTTVTPLSRYLAMFLFIALPFIGFLLGSKYEQQFTQYIESRATVDQYKVKSLPPNTQDPSTASPAPNGDRANWKTYTSREGKFIFKHPEDWHFKTAKENYGVNYNGARIEILFSNKLDKNGKIPSGVNIDRSTAHGLIAVNGCRYASGCDVWANEAKFYDIKDPAWQGGGGPYPTIKKISISELGGKKAILIKSQADTNAVVYNGEYSIQYNVLLGNTAKERLTLTFTYNSQNQDNEQILDAFDQILSTFQFTN